MAVVARALGYHGEKINSDDVQFMPIPDTYWSAGEFKYVVSKGLGRGLMSYIANGDMTSYNENWNYTGYSNEDFKLNYRYSNATLEAVCAFLLDVTGYGKQVKNKNYIQKANELGLFEGAGLDTYEPTAPVKRISYVSMVDNAVNLPLWLTEEELKSGQINWATFKHNCTNPTAELCNGNGASGRYETLLSFVNKLYIVNGYITSTSNNHVKFHIDSSANFHGNKVENLNINVETSDVQDLKTIINQPMQAIISETNELCAIYSRPHDSKEVHSFSVSPQSGFAAASINDRNATEFIFTAVTSKNVKRISLSGDIDEGQHEISYTFLKDNYNLSYRDEGNTRIWTCKLPLFRAGGNRKITLNVATNYTDTLPTDYSVNIIVSEKPIEVQIAGKNVEFDVPPQIINDRTMVPLRAIFEAIGAEVTWHGETQTVTATDGNMWVSLTVGQNIMHCAQPNASYDESIKLDSAPVNIDGRVLIPARAVAEAFDCDVEWDAQSRTVYIYE